MILVSACLLGHRTRYDGRHSKADDLLKLIEDRQVLAVCPEMLGGLGVPRPPARFQGAAWGREGSDVLAGRARLVNSQGVDVSRAFINGSRDALKQALETGVRRAYLKDRSPSCGHDPKGVNPQGGPGQGVFTALLLEHGVEIIEVRAAARDD